MSDIAWSTPRNWENGEIPTQTEFNAHLRDNMRELWHEVAYVEFTADVTVTSAVAATPTDIVSSGAIVYVANPILIEFYSPYVNPSANTELYLSLWDATTGLMILAAASSDDQARGGGAIHAVRRLTPTAASHTYKIRGWNSSGSTGLVRAGAGGTEAAWAPGFIRILAKGGA